MAGEAIPCAHPPSSLVPMGLIWCLAVGHTQTMFLLHSRQTVWHHHTGEGFKLRMVK